MAERRSHSSGSSGRLVEPGRPAYAAIARPGRVLPPPANDNKAPLLTRLRRLLLFALLLLVAAALLFAGSI